MMADKLFTKRLRDLTDEAIRESLAEINVEFEKRFGPAAWNTRATQPLSLTVETGDSQQSAAFDVLNWLRDNREAIIDRLQSLSLPVGDGAIERAARAIVISRGGAMIAKEPIWSEQVARYHQLCAEYPDYADAHSLINDAFRDAKAVLSALGEQIAENANCSGDIDRSGLAQEVDDISYAGAGT